MCADSERCLQEIARAGLAVMYRCNVGDYIWLRDWQAELELIRQEAAAPVVD